MIKFKIIKEYPGSDPIGTIITGSRETMYSKGLGFTNYDWSHVENQPDFWEEVIEKDYEVTQVLYANEIRTLFDGLYSLYPDGVGFELEYLLNNDGKIHSVKRLSDGETFSVGDRIDIGDESGNYVNIRTISMININFSGELVIDHEYGGLTNNKLVGTFHRIKQAPLEYQILSYIKKGSPKCITTKKRGGIHHHEFWRIRSVKRLSDGEVFTIGDTIDFDGIKKARLLEIEFETAPKDKGTGKLCFVNDCINLGKWWSINELTKVKTLILSTEDGVDIYVGDRFWFIERYDYTIFNAEAISSIGKSPSTKYFSTEEAAQKYVLKNKPCLSFDDVKRALSLNLNESITLMDLIKSKL